MKERFLIEMSNPKRLDVARRAVAAIKEAALAGVDFMVVLGDVVRTLDQNAAMWPALTDICKQVPLAIVCKNGGTRTAKPDDWKDVMTAAFEEETEWAPGLRGGIVMLGARTSKYGKRKMGDFLTFLRAEGNERGVVWSEKAQDKFDQYIDSRKAA